MNPIYVRIVNEPKDYHVRHIDGASGAVYTFHWNRDFPGGGCYTYAPRSQEELDDIMSAQSVYDGVFFSVWVPGVFDTPAAAPQDAPEDTPEPRYGPPHKIPEPDLSQSPGLPIPDFRTCGEDTIRPRLDAIEDKNTLSEIIREYGGKPPPKQSKSETFRQVAETAIRSAREPAAAESIDV